MKRKWISLLLVLVLAAALCVPVFAAEEAEEPQYTGVEAIVRRAYQMTQVQWTPAADVVGWAEDVTYTAGTTYTGLPYGQPVDAQYVPWETDLEGFLAAVADPDSALYTEYAEYNSRAPYLSCDCSGFVSWAWGLKTRKIASQLMEYGELVSEEDFDDAEVGDALIVPSHAALITDIVRDGSGNLVSVEISEATTNPYKDYLAHSTRYGAEGDRPLELLQKIYLDNGYGIYRNPERGSVTYAHICDIPLEGDVCTVCGYGVPEPEPEPEPTPVPLQERPEVQQNVRDHMQQYIERVRKGEILD